MESSGQGCRFALAASPIYRQFSALAVPEVPPGEGFEISAKNHKAEETWESLPARSCPAPIAPSPPRVLGEVPLKIFWLIQSGWKVLPGPQSVGDVSFPPSRCSLAGHYAREGLTRFGSS